MFFKIEGFYKNWGGFSLENISLEMEEGQYFALLGPCGAGKTLLLNGIAGFYRPDSGDIYVKEKKITFLPTERRNIGYLFQKDALFAHLSVRENIRYGLRYANPDEKYLDKIFQLLGIEQLFGRKDTFNLSGGEARKIALARSLAVKPGILMLDEPLSFLDPLSRVKVMESLVSLNKQLGISIIHVTHDIQEIKNIAQKAAVLFEGKIAQSGTVDNILSQPLDLLKDKFWGDPCSKI